MEHFAHSYSCGNKTVSCEMPAFKRTNVAISIFNQEINELIVHTRVCSALCLEVISSCRLCWNRRQPFAQENNHSKHIRDTKICLRGSVKTTSLGAESQQLRPYEEFLFLFWLMLQELGGIYLYPAYMFDSDS